MELVAEHIGVDVQLAERQLSGLVVELELVAECSVKDQVLGMGLGSG